LPPHLLELELTETVLMAASHESGEILPGLRHAGVTIAIDDFGTGYFVARVSSAIPGRSHQDRAELRQESRNHAR